MFHDSSKLRSLFICGSLLLTLSLTACLGPDNPLILQVETTPEAGVEAEAVIAEGATVAPADVGIGEVAPVSEAGDDAVPVEEINFDQALLQATFLLDREIKNQSGEEIGSVEDLIIDVQTGQILYVLLDRDAFLGLDSETVPLPLAVFDWNKELVMILTIDEASLDSAPAVADDWPIDVAEGWDADVAAFWQEQGLLSERNSAAAPVHLQPLIGIHAGGLGADLGVVEDFLLNVGNEQVAYLAIFTADGFYAPNQVLIVPFTTTELTIEAVDSGPVYGITLLAVDESVLNQAPSMDRSLFLTVDLLDQTFAAELDTYWSQQQGATGQ